MTQWQDIESVPKDRTFVKILSTSGDEFVARLQIEYDLGRTASDRLRFKERLGRYNIQATHWKPNK